MKTEIKKLHRDVLLEWGYDKTNLILEPYRIIKNSKDLINSYEAFESTITNNSEVNQLFVLDATLGKYAKVDTSSTDKGKKYNFLSFSDYIYPTPTRHDRCRIYFPANYNFGEYQGIYLRIYTYDYQNKKFFDLSNFFFDVDDDSTSNLLTSSISPLLYQNLIWNKYIELQIPSLYAASRQRQGGAPILGSLNSTLTEGRGLSQTAPIFIDFRFITKIVQVSGTKNYFTSRKSTFQIPQIPQLEDLQLFVGESKDGDYFEIYPTYQGLFERFVVFTDDSIRLGKDYYLEFDITVFEENIPGKTYTYKIENDFTEIIEFRPIIKYSSTKAIIDVEMRLINRDGGNTITRKSSYGMKPDQLSKYLVSLKKINVRNTFKPKIYVKNQYNRWPIDTLGISPASLTDSLSSSGSAMTPVTGNGATPTGSLPTGMPGSTPRTPGKEDNRGNPISSIDVLVPELTAIIGNSTQISAYSSQALNTIRTIKIQNYHYMGLLKIGIKPFDNFYKFILANKSSDETQLEPFDLTNCQEVKLVIRTDDKKYEFPQYFSAETVARLGVCQFKIPETSFLDIKQSFSQGFSIFYITNTAQGMTNVIYAGLYTILDTAQSLGAGTINDILNDLNTSTDTTASNNEPLIVTPPGDQEVAIVTRRRVPISSKNSSSTSTANKKSGEELKNDKFKNTK
jgi:hypothetical protein